MAFEFITALCNMFYGFGIFQRLGGLLKLAQCFILPGTVAKSRKTKGE